MFVAVPNQLCPEVFLAMPLVFVIRPTVAVLTVAVEEVVTTDILRVASLRGETLAGAVVALGQRVLCTAVAGGDINLVIEQ